MGALSQHHQLLVGNEFERCHAAGSYVIVVIIVWKFTCCWAMFRKPQPVQLVRKVRQYTSHLYGSTPPIRIAVLSWLLSFEERETLQYAPHLYGSTFGKILGVGVTRTFLSCLWFKRPFPISQLLRRNLD